MKSERTEKKIGIFAKDDLTDRFCESWEKAMAVYNFETIDISASIAYIMAVKEKIELAAIQDGCSVLGDVFRLYLKPHILELISDHQVS